MKNFDLTNITFLIGRTHQNFVIDKIIDRNHRTGYKYSTSSNKPYIRFDFPKAITLYHLIFRKQNIGKNKKKP